MPTSDRPGGREEAGHTATPAGGANMPSAAVLAVAAAATLSFPALWPLLRPGFFVSDDGLFHLYRLAALGEALRAGVLFPRWFPDLAFGYGFPVLNFYSPLGYYLAAAFQLFVGDAVVALKLAFAAALLLSGLAMYLFAREPLGRWGAALASLAYVYAPYHLADVYRRGALAESLAFVFFPLVLWSCRRLAVRRRWTDAAVLSVAAAGLILTHNLSAMLLVPLAAAYLLYCFWESEARGPALGGRESGKRHGIALVLAAALLAAGLSAFYVLPVLTEGRFAHLSYDYNSTGYAKHLAPLGGVVSPWPAYRYFPDQGVAAERPLGLAQAILVAATLPMLAFRIRRRQAWRGLAFWWAALLVSLGMTLALSLPLWQVLQPALSMIQYPWRFMGLVDLSAAVLIGSLLAAAGEGPRNAALPSGRGVMGRFVAFGAVSVVLMGNALPNLPTPALPLTGADVTVERMWQEDYRVQQIGATWTAEFLPLTVREERWAIPRAPLQPENEAELPAGVTVRLGAQGLLSHEFLTDAANGFPLRLHAFWFPGWQASVDGRPVEVRPTGRLGLVTVDVPAGRHTVRLAFAGTASRQAGAVMSVLSLLGLSALLVGRRARRLGAVWAVLLLAVLLVCVWPPATVQPDRVGAELGGSVRLLASRVQAPQVYSPGDTVRLDLYWMASRMLPGYKVFVHVVDASGAVVAQHDGEPVGGFTPTTRWLPGEVVADVHEVRLPAGLAPGSYAVLAGLYDFDTMRNLDARDEAGVAYAGARVPVGRVTVTAR